MTQMSSSMIKPTVTPKGVNRLRPVFCDTVRRYRTPYILYWIAMVIFGPLAAIIDYVNTFGNPNLLHASSWGGSDLFGLCMLITLGASVVIPMVVFSYLDNRRALDVFHALPVTRGKLFWGNMLATLFLLFAPFVVCVLPVAAAVDLSPLWLNPVDPAVDFSMLRVSGFIVGAALMMCGLMVLLMICCSTVVESFGYFCILMVGYTIVVRMGFNLIGQYTFGFSDFWLEEFLLRFTPLSFIFSTATTTGDVFWIPALQMTVLGVLLTLLGWRRYVRRKSEQAGGYIWAPVYYVAAVMGALAAGLYIRGVLGSGNDGIDVVAGAVTAVLVFIVLDTIRHRGFKQIVRSAVTSAAGVAGVAVLAVVINLTGTFGYEGWVPDAADVLAVKVQSGAPANLSSAFPLTDTESIQTVIDFHKSVVGNQQPLETGSAETLVEYDPYGFTSVETIDQSYGSVYLTITYEMKNGSEKIREYVVPVVMTKPLYELSGSVRYYCAIADAVDAYAERIQTMEAPTIMNTRPASAEVYAGGVDESGELFYSFELNYPGMLQRAQGSSFSINLSQEDTVDFLDCLAADLRRRGDDSERPAEEQPVGAVDLGSLGMGNYGNTLYLYESDVNTIGFLTEQGYYTEDEGLVYYGSCAISGTPLAVIPAELAEEVGGSAFHFSGDYLMSNGGYSWDDTEDGTAEETEDSQVMINLYPNGTMTDDGSMASAILVRGAVKYLSEDEVKELASLVYAEGYSDEPMDLLFIDGETWFIPEENVERVSEIIYG